MRLLSEHPKETSPTRSAKSSIAKLPSLETGLQYLKGVGPRKAALLRRKDLENLRDALYFFPFRYEDRRKIFRPRDLATIPEGSLVCVKGRKRSVREIPLRGGQKKILELCLVGDAGDELVCSWFHTYKGMRERLESLDTVICTGNLKYFRSYPQLMHPDIECDSGIHSLHWGRIVPIYSGTEGLTQKSLREIIHQALELCLPLIVDDLPAALVKRKSLMPLRDCLWEMHFPQALPTANSAENSADASQALPAPLQRLIFEEFFKYQILQICETFGKSKENAPAIPLRARLTYQFRKSLPFRLTLGQEQAIVDILTDLRKTTPMNRILQGDVGCGKTLVALFALAEISDSGFQGALMAPTESLAEQHYRNAQRLFSGSPVQAALLTGSLTAREKLDVRARLHRGEVQVLIGTHAILEEGVEWDRLGLVIIDEQHRFGVRQRSLLRRPNRKGEIPHLLTMTATPIPRSLALTIFGDLSVTSIRERPAERQAIATKVVPGSQRQKVYNLIKREVKNGRQSYIIYPLVQNSEKERMSSLKSVAAEFARLQAGPLQGLRLTMLHGQMPSTERQEILQDFVQGKFDVLIATTVIEVGIDVPNATVVVIENAERFGLSQLHQLRGRVGRGAHKSYCVLVTDIPEKQNSIEPNLALYFSDDARDEPNIWHRLRVLENSQDGFAISEEDLKLRGPGDFLGTKQSGSPTFRLANLVRDRELFVQARSEALALLEKDPNLELEEHKNLRIFCQSTLEALGHTLKSG